MTLRQLITRVALVAIVALVVGVVAYVLSASQTKQYQATAQILFAPRTSELQALGLPGGPLDQTSAAANDVLDVASFDIARRTALALADPRYSADTVAGDVAVSNERGSDVVTIKANASTPQEAARLAGTYLREYQDVSKARTAAQASSGRDALASALAALPKTLRNGARGDVMRNQIGILEVFARTGNPPTVIQNVRATANPVSPQTSRNVLFGLLFGVVLGAGLVAARGAISPPRRD